MYTINDVESILLNYGKVNSSLREFEKKNSSKHDIKVISSIEEARSG